MSEGGWRPLPAPAGRRGLARIWGRTGESAFARLALVHVLAVAGDTLITMALAGSLFFSMSPHAARNRVALVLPAANPGKLRSLKDLARPGLRLVTTPEIVPIGRYTEEVVRKLALASTAFKRDGWYPEDLAAMSAISAEAFAGTPIHDAYLRTSPKPDAWPTVVTKVRQLVTSDYDWTAGVAALKTPTLILVGDADGLRLAHAVEFFALLGGGQADGDLAGLPRSSLAVLPATTHVGWAPPYHGIMTRTHLLLPILTEFLDAPKEEG